MTQTDSPQDDDVISEVAFERPLPLAGRNVALRPISPEDYGWAFEAALMTSVGGHWRLHGDIPSFDEFIRGLLSSSKATMVITETGTLNRIGIAQLLNYDAFNQHGHLSVFLTPGYEARGWPIEGVFLFCNYVFGAFNLRKLYLESLEDEAKTYLSLGDGILRQEGHLKAHRYCMGKYYDAYILAMYRDDFVRVRPFVLRSPAH